MATKPWTGATGGNDTAEGEYDLMEGLAGHDRLGSTFKGMDGPVTIDGGSGNDYLYARHEVGAWGTFIGGDGDDYIDGGSTSNVDTIYGGSGNDGLVGGYTQYGDGAD